MVYDFKRLWLALINLGQGKEEESQNIFNAFLNKLPHCENLAHRHCFSWLSFKFCCIYFN